MPKKTAVPSDWRITAQLVLSLDPAADLDGAQVVYEAHLARANRNRRVTAAMSGGAPVHGRPFNGVPAVRGLNVLH